MMTLPYVLRQLTRKQGVNYALAVDTLMALCSQVGMPREAKTLIMEELEQVLSVENDELLNKYAGDRLEVCGELDEEDEEQAVVAENETAYPAETVIRNGKSEPRCCQR